MKNILVSMSNEDGKFGFINQNNELVIPYIYSEVLIGFKGNDKYYKVKQNGKWGIVTKDGVEIIPCKYSNIIPADGKFFIIINENGKQGVANINGEVIANCVYDYISGAKNGLFDVEIAGNRGIMDVSGKAYFGEKNIAIVEKYNDRIQKSKTLIQTIIRGDVTEKEILATLTKGKKYTNYLRTEMAREIRGLSPEIQEDDSLLDCRKRASESIELF